MSEIKCRSCGAECVAGTSFCRQCGAPIDGEAAHVASEQATAILDHSVGVATQHLESRATRPDRGRLPDPADDPTTKTPEKRVASRRGILIGAVVLVVIGFLTAAAMIGLRSHKAKTEGLIYPGAKMVVDMTGEGGGRAFHLETSDSFKDVEEWYQKVLKPEKTMRLTSTSVVLKNNKTTATIASESNKTNILIKVAP